MSTLLNQIKERTLFLDRMEQTREAKEARVAKLKANGLHIDEAAPTYKETYTGNK